MYRSAFSPRCRGLVEAAIKGFPIALKSNPGSGWGLYATRPIAELEVVLRESPAIDMARDLEWFEGAYVEAAAGTDFEEEYTDVDFGAAAMVRGALSEGVKPSESLFWKGLSWVADEVGAPKLDEGTTAADLAGKFAIASRIFARQDVPGWGLEEYALLRAKWQANGLGDLQLFIAISKFNHSCKNNVGWDPRDPQGYSLAAAYDIAEGEELTIAYKDAHDPTRNNLFRDHWGFECKCEICSAEALERRSEST
ncbi:hypothetical protein M885DRAFT_617760 [Pelagophyceae sp. CCMP2097]|nr:hypothetical protein M885DRAFT_617760 [Pelagophyceae sp. CCMP2097]